MTLQPPFRIIGVVAFVCLIVVGLLPASADEQTPSETVVGLESARTLTDSLLEVVSRARHLRPLRQVPVRVASRADLLARRQQIASEDRGAETAQRQRLLQYLGLIPKDIDLRQLERQLLEERLRGFYDIDAREMVLPDWVPRDLQADVVTHELVHALQDQHFSLRVRKKLGFDSPDAEMAWHSLLEGDAAAVLFESKHAADRANFATLADSLASSFGDSRSGCGDDSSASEIFLSAPSYIRESMTFPHAQGLRFAAALFQAGGWQRLDDAYIQPPTSSEQIMHPKRFVNVVDVPVRIELPDLRGVLGQTYVPLLARSLGELELYLYLKQYIDPEIAAIGTEGWAGCSVAMYGDSPQDPDAFVLSTVWDSEDDALEFFGALIGVLEMRYPQQEGWGEVSSENVILWKLDEDTRYVNMLRLRGREVVCVEHAPGSSYLRVMQKLDRYTRMDDAAPELRAITKDRLVWNRPANVERDSALTLRVQLPDSWTQDTSASRPNVITEARRAGARVQVVLDREAQDQLGVGGYAHALAQRLQKNGTNVYIETDVLVPRQDVQLYQYVFTQLERGRQMVYYVAVADLKRGFGYVMMSEPKDGTTPPLSRDFTAILDSLQVVPVEDATPDLATPIGGFFDPNEN